MPKKPAPKKKPAAAVKRPKLIAGGRLGRVGATYG